MPDKPALGAAGDGWPDGLPRGKVRPILIHPHPDLRRVCEFAGYLSAAEQQDLAGDLLASMYHAQGRGLAAPQIGRAHRVFVMDAGWKAGRPSPLVALDPEIVDQSTETDEAEEQCLSIPGQPMVVSRPAWVTACWYDLQGKRHQHQLTGREARIFQHEFDHLDGRLIADVT